MEKKRKVKKRKENKRKKVHWVISRVASQLKNALNSNLLSTNAETPEAKY